MDILKNFRNLPIFKIIPLECEFTEIAITDSPAIEEYFLKFNSKEVKLEFNADKMIITGPVMTPNTLIYRNDSLGERFVTYDEDGIKMAAGLFMKNGLRFNLEHTDKILPIEIIESYFAVADNKFDVPEGSWIVSAKVNDKDLWGKFKENKLGFSFQSLFKNELIGVEKLNFNNEERMNLKEKLSAAINTVLFSETEAPVDVVETPAVEEVVVEETVETVVEMSAEEVVEETPEAPEAPVVDEAIQNAINEAIAIARDEIMTEVASVLAELQAQNVEMSAQLEKFSKEPLSIPITETVTNPVKLETPYSYLQGINN